VNLHQACCAVLVDKTVEDPCEKIREMLLAYARAIAKKRNGRPYDWSVYVERHGSQVRFILYDPKGGQVDLEKLPADPEELRG
jgi:hypothetical protein